MKTLLIFVMVVSSGIAQAQNQTLALSEIDTIMEEAEIAAPTDALSQHEISTVLSGNWFEGTWYGDAYRQVFNVHEIEGEPALTEYMPRLGGPTVGTWRAEQDDNGTGQYCSNWPPSHNWDCYYIVRDGEDGLWWLDEIGNEPQPFAPFTF